MSGDLCACAAMDHPNLLGVLSRSLQASGRQPAPATLSPHGRTSRPSSRLELSGKGKAKAWLPRVHY